MECQVCVGAMTPKQQVKCGFCEYVACSQCVRQYLCSVYENPHCMNCRHERTRDIMLQYLPRTFVIKDYKGHRENVIFERERSMMPSTQVYVDQELQRRQNVKLLASLKKERNELKRKLDENSTLCLRCS